MSTFYLDYENGSDSNDGSSWANAWKTITDGATAARIAAGDTIRIAKSPAPTSIGNATWTNASRTVTLASALTATIENCEAGWTSDHVDIGTNLGGDRKQGTYCSYISFSVNLPTSTLLAHKSFTAIDLSSYQKLSLWFKTENYPASENNFYIALCTDTAGAVVDKTFKIPATVSSSAWTCFTLSSEEGGNISSSIQSVALYSGTSAPAAFTYCLLDNIIACTTSGLSLTSLISKSSLEQGGTEGWYCIKYIDGTTVEIDQGTDANAGVGQGYSTSGTSPETVTTYKRETIKTTRVQYYYNDVQVVQDSGTTDALITFSGGWNTSSTEQDGETYWDGTNSYGYGISISSKSCIRLERISLCRYSIAISLNQSNFCEIVDIANISNNSNTGISLYSASNIVVSNVESMNNNSSFGLTAQNGIFNKVVSCTARNNSNAGLNIINIAKIIFTDSVFGNNLYSDATVVSSGCYFSNCKFYTGNEFTISDSLHGTIIYSGNHDQTANNHRQTFYAGSVVSDQSERHTAAGISWKLTVFSTIRGLAYPIWTPIAKIACTASSQVTAKAWFKKTHASDIGARLICEGGQISGVDDDVYDTKANDTDWEELSISFTPDESGVVEIKALAYWLANEADDSVYVDDITITSP